MAQEGEWTNKFGDSLSLGDRADDNAQTYARERGGLQEGRLREEQADHRADQQGEGDRQSSEGAVAAAFVSASQARGAHVEGDLPAQVLLDQFQQHVHQRVHTD